MSVRDRVIVAAVAAVLVLSMSATCFSQTYYMHPVPEQKAKFGLRFLDPNFSEDQYLDKSLLGGTYDLYADVPISSRLNLIATIPFTLAKYKLTSWWYEWQYEADETGIGNICLGIQTAGTSDALWRSVLSADVCLPTASDEKYYAVSVGYFSDLHEFRRVIPNMWVFGVNFAEHFVQHKTIGPLLGAEVGLEAFVPTSDGSDVELFGHYGATGGVKYRCVAISAELVGMAIITEDVDSFGDRFDHQLTFGLAVVDYPIRPHLSYQFPLDEAYDGFLDGVLGIKLEVAPF